MDVTSLFMKIPFKLIRYSQGCVIKNIATHCIECFIKTSTSLIILDAQTINQYTLTFYKILTLIYLNL